MPLCDEPLRQYRLVLNVKLQVAFVEQSSKRQASMNHGVIIYGEDTYCQKVVFYLSALKPKAEMVPYDLDKPENITDL